MTEPPPVITGIHAGLDVRAGEYGANPVADWLCVCGHHERATGRDAVLELLGRVRVGHCPHTKGAPPS